MIPERKEPQLNRTLFFPDAHAELLRDGSGCVVRSGSRLGYWPPFTLGIVFERLLTT